MQNVFSSIHSVKHILCEMCLAANIPQNVVYPKCIWQHTFHQTWFIQNVFSSEHSVGVGADLSCPYQRNCKKICCVVRWFHSAIMVRNDEEAGAMNQPLRLTECTWKILHNTSKQCGDGHRRIH